MAMSRTIHRDDRLAATVIAENIRHTLGHPIVSVSLLAAIAALSFVPPIHGPGSAVAPLASHSAMPMAMTGTEAGSRPTTQVTPVSCQKLPDIPGKSMTTAIVDFPPGAYSPRHRHPGSVTAFVLKGSIRSQLIGGPAETFKAGQTWFEPPGAIHLFAENASATEPAALLAIFVTDDDCGPLSIPD